MNASSKEFERLFTHLEYNFSNASLLEQALTHKSFTKNHARGYERLEFLGDRVLGLVIADMLLTRFTAESEGQIAKRHASLVSRESLVKIAAQLDLSSLIQMPQGDRMAGAAQQASVQADAMEALLGAIYLDSGLEAARRVIQRFWQPLLDSAETPPIDAKSALQEWAQARGRPLPVYTLEKRSGAAHVPQFFIQVSVEGLPPYSAAAGSKKAAEQAAAQAALGYIQEQGI